MAPSRVHVTTVRVTRLQWFDQKHAHKKKRWSKRARFMRRSVPLTQPVRHGTRREVSLLKCYVPVPRLAPPRRQRVLIAIVERCRPFVWIQLPLQLTYSRPRIRKRSTRAVLLAGRPHRVVRSVPTHILCVNSRLSHPPFGTRSWHCRARRKRRSLFIRGRSHCRVSCRGTPKETFRGFGTPTGRHSIGQEPRLALPSKQQSAHGQSQQTQRTRPALVS